MRSTGLVLAAGGIAIANEVVFAPIAAGETAASKEPNSRQVFNTGFNAATDTLSGFNWRIIPATVILALMLAGLEKAAPDFAVGLAGLTVGAVLLIPVGNARTPLENVTKALGY